MAVYRFEATERFIYTKKGIFELTKGNKKPFFGGNGIPHKSKRKSILSRKDLIEYKYLLNTVKVGCKNLYVIKDSKNIYLYMVGKETGGIRYFIFFTPFYRKIVKFYHPKGIDFKSKIKEVQDAAITYEEFKNLCKIEKRRK